MSKVAQGTDDTPPMGTAMNFFSLEEMRCRDGTPYPSEWVATRWPALVSTLNTIRVAWGAPLAVVSGYRSPAHNATLAADSNAKGLHGVASGSQHMEGNAADIRPMNGSQAENAKLHTLILDLHSAGRLPLLGGLGRYPGWCHVDTHRAADGHLRRWG